ncbi:MAG: DMT family transporter [Oscillospiraceae bacterium]|nr:DMT family transporter [Oscillospiraceae bacterium]
MRNILKSISKNKKGIVYILISAFLLALGQLFWKLSGTAINLQMIIGFLCYGVGAITMVIAFKFGSMSVLHPMMSTSILFSILFGYFIFNEQITIYKVLGIFFIILGVIFIGGGDEK